MTGILLPLLIAVVAIASLVVLFLLLSSKKQEKGKSKKASQKKSLQAKDRNHILKESNRRLAQNPKDPEALNDLADLYWREENWERSMKTYEALIELCGSNPDLDEFEINLRFGLSSLKQKRFEEAYKGFYIAHTLKQEHYEVNFNLGLLEFNKKAYEKALPLLVAAKNKEPENPQALRYLGHCYFKLHNFKEALATLRKVVDLEPDDKESLFAIAESYFELGNPEQAIKIFTHLRPDPVMGPSAALFSGTIHLNQHQYQKAAMDFEIGLKHENIKLEVMIELKYRLAAAYLKEQDVAMAVGIFNEIQATYPGYKDVAAQLSRYQELNSNRNLQIFMLANTSDFVTLCRKIAMSFFPKAKVKIVDITVQKNEYADILAEVETKKWADTIIFRFIRSNGQIGELLLRDLYSKIRDMKAGKGYCITTGNFTDEAKRFVEARLIDLMEKEKLIKLLMSLDSGVNPFNHE